MEKYKGTKSSFDAYNPKTKRIQIKASSINPDATSFGPKSETNLLYGFFRMDHGTKKLMFYKYQMI